MNLFQSFLEVVHNQGEREAFSQGEVRFSYSELLQLIEAYALSFRKAGISRGDRIAFYLENSPLFVIAVWACWREGLTVIPINVRLPVQEASELFFKAKASRILTSPTFSSSMDKFKDEGLEVIIMDLENPPAYPSSPFSCPYVDGEDIAAIFFTSGTSGLPKGAMLTHSNFLFNVKASRNLFEISEKDQFAVTSPLFHSFAFTVCHLLPLLTGSSMKLPKSSSTEDIQEVLMKSQELILVGVPPFFEEMLQKFKKEHLSSLRLAVSGGASLSTKLRKLFHETFGIWIMEGYGATECSPVISAQKISDTDHPSDSVGKPLPGTEIQVWGQSPVPLSCGRTGEIMVRGPHVMKGYFNDLAATEEAFRGEWYATGDIGYLDQEGFLTILDRKMDVLTIDGIQIYPLQIEKKIQQNSSVQEVAVVGMVCDDGASGVLAFVVPVVTPSPSGLTEELLEYCRNHLPVYMVPKVIEFRVSLPKTVAGKVLKRSLRQKWM